jgi:hypothetical protein
MPAARSWTRMTGAAPSPLLRCYVVGVVRTRVLAWLSFGSAVALTASCGQTRGSAGSAAEAAGFAGLGSDTGGSHSGGTVSGGASFAGRGSGTGGVALARGCVAHPTIPVGCKEELQLGLYVLDSPLAKDVLIADVDEDGQTDLVTNHEAWTQFTIGQPVRQRFSEDESARLVGVGALDEDGRPGLVLVNEETGVLTVLAASPPLKFVELGTLAATPNAAAIALADLNRDGIADIGIGDRQTMRPVVAFGSGDGGFEFASEPPAAEDSLPLAMGELNGDAFVDAVLLRRPENEVVVLHGDGTGEFEEHQTLTIESVASFTLADVDNDGAADLVTAHSNSNLDAEQVRLGDGDGGFGEASGFKGAIFPSRVLAADVTQDAALDLVVTFERSTLGAILYSGNGDGSFERDGLLMSWSPTYGSAVGDLNGDRMADIALAQGERVSVAWGSAGGVPKVAHTRSTALDLILGNDFAEQWGLSLADLNGDAHLDAVVSSGSTEVFLGNGDGTFGEPAALPGERPAVADFDGDERSDIVLMNAGKVSLFRGYGDGTFDEGTELGISAERLTTADFDGDGPADLLVSGARVEWWLNQGDGSFELAAEGVGFGEGALSVAATDLDCDQKLDALVGSFTSLGIVLSDPTASASSGLLLRPMADHSAIGYFALALGDFNHDSIRDLVVTQHGSLPMIAGGAGTPGALLVLLGRGDGSFQAPFEVTNARHPHSVVAGDLDGDGRLDLAVSDTRDGITVWTGNGDGTFEGPFEVFVTELDRQAKLELADLDADGRLDLVAFYRNRIVSWLNTSFRVCEE